MVLFLLDSPRQRDIGGGVHSLEPGFRLLFLGYKIILSNLFRHHHCDLCFCSDELGITKGELDIKTIRLVMLLCCHHHRQSCHDVDDVEHACT